MKGLEQTAAAIANARLTHTRLDVLPPDSRPATPHAGYLLQDAVHTRLSARLGPLVGWKIGCTTAVMQAMLDIPSPCYGGILQSGMHRGKARLMHADYCRPGVECEIPWYSW